MELINFSIVYNELGVSNFSTKWNLYDVVKCSTDHLCVEGPTIFYSRYSRSSNDILKTVNIKEINLTIKETHGKNWVQ